jgi:hypothetical protein
MQPVRSHELSTSASVRASKQAPSSSDTTKAAGSTTTSSSLPKGSSSDLGKTPVESHAELTEEADTLVSELGVITKRKKALTTAASAAGVPAEDVEGRKGEEYKELLQREEKVRRRLEEVQRALSL